MEKNFPLEQWVNEKEGLKHCGFSEKLYIETLRSVQKQIPMRMEHMVQCLNDKDYQNYIIEAHTLKSNTALIGAVTLSEEAKALEYAGKEKQYDYLHNNTNIFLEHMEGLLQALNNGGLSAVDVKEDRQCMPFIEECFNCLESGENEFAHEALEVLEVYQCSKRLEEQVNEIKQYILKGEADKAKIKLQHILQEE